MKKQLNNIILILFFFFVSDDVLSQVYIELNHSQPPELKATDLEDITINSGESAQLGGTGIVSGGTTPYVYIWEPSIGLNNANFSNPTVSPAETTTYTLTVVDDQGCKLITQQTVNVNQVSSVVGIPSDQYFMIYPNPSNGVFSFVASDLKSSTVFNISIYSLIGQQIYEEKFFLNSDTFTKEIDLSDQPGGSYIAKIQLDQKITIKLIILQ